MRVACVHYTALSSLCVKLLVRVGSKENILDRVVQSFTKRDSISVASSVALEKNLYLKPYDKDDTKTAQAHYHNRAFNTTNILKKLICFTLIA